MLYNRDASKSLQSLTSTSKMEHLNFKSGCVSKAFKRRLDYSVTVILNAKQKHPGCKKSVRPIISSIANRYVRPKTLISVEAKKLLIKNLLE